MVKVVIKGVGTDRLIINLLFKRMNKAVASAIFATVAVAEEQKATFVVNTSADAKVGDFETILSIDGNDVTAKFKVTSVTALTSPGAEANTGVCGPWAGTNIDLACLTAKAVKGVGAAVTTVAWFEGKAATPIKFDANGMAVSDMTEKCKAVSDVSSGAASNSECSVTKAAALDGESKIFTADITAKGTEAAMKAWTADWTKVKVGGYLKVSDTNKGFVDLKAAGLTNPAGAYAATAALSVAAAVFAVTAF
jgi:hypothetical protein